LFVLSVPFLSFPFLSVPFPLVEELLEELLEVLLVELVDEVLEVLLPAVLEELPPAPPFPTAVDVAIAGPASRITPITNHRRQSKCFVISPLPKKTACDRRYVDARGSVDHDG
jgi:hypothetical protein